MRNLEDIIVVKNNFLGDEIIRLLESCENPKYEIDVRRRYSHDRVGEASEIELSIYSVNRRN